MNSQKMFTCYFEGPESAISVNLESILDNQSTGYAMHQPMVALQVAHSVAVAVVWHRALATAKETVNYEEI